MESAIVQNQEFMGWWMNFDNGFDYLALLLYIGGVALVIMHFVMGGQKKDEMFSEVASIASNMTNCGCSMDKRARLRSLLA